MREQTPLLKLTTACRNHLVILDGALSSGSHLPVGKSVLLDFRPRSPAKKKQRHNTLSAQRLGNPAKFSVRGNVPATRRQPLSNLGGNGQTTSRQRIHFMDRMFEAHENPNRSQIERWRAEIITMRSLNWPYHRIAKWLEDEGGLSVSKEAVRKFCLLRNIEKGQELPPPPSPLRPQPRVRNQPQERLFTFDQGDAEKAIRIIRE